MVAQLLPEFLILHAASGGLSEFFEATASLAGYFPKPTAVDPLGTFGAFVDSYASARP